MSSAITTPNGLNAWWTLRSKGHPVKNIYTILTFLMTIIGLLSFIKLCLIYPSCTRWH